LNKSIKIENLNEPSYGKYFAQIDGITIFLPEYHCPNIHF
jgi:hypothetical protein